MSDALRDAAQRIVAALEEIEVHLPSAISDDWTVDAHTTCLTLRDLRALRTALERECAPDASRDRVELMAARAGDLSASWCSVHDKPRARFECKSCFEELAAIALERPRPEPPATFSARQTQGDELCNYCGERAKVFFSLNPEATPDICPACFVTALGFAEPDAETFTLLPKRSPDGAALPPQTGNPPPREVVRDLWLMGRLSDRPGWWQVWRGDNTLCLETEAQACAVRDALNAVALRGNL